MENKILKIEQTPYMFFNNDEFGKNKITWFKNYGIKEVFRECGHRHSVETVKARDGFSLKKFINIRSNNGIKIFFKYANNI